MPGFKPRQYGKLLGVRKISTALCLCYRSGKPDPLLPAGRGLGAEAADCGGGPAVITASDPAVPQGKGRADPALWEDICGSTAQIREAFCLHLGATLLKKQQKTTGSTPLSLSKAVSPLLAGAPKEVRSFLPQRSEHQSSCPQKSNNSCNVRARIACLTL